MIDNIKDKEKTSLSLGAKLDEYHKMNAGFQEEYQSLKDENTWLKYKMAHLLLELYGQKWECFENRDNGQLPLPFEAEPEARQKIDEQVTQKITYESRNAGAIILDAASGSSAGGGDYYRTRGRYY